MGLTLDNPDTSVFNPAWGIQLKTNGDHRVRRRRPAVAQVRPRHPVHNTRRADHGDPHRRVGEDRADGRRERQADPARQVPPGRHVHTEAVRYGQQKRAEVVTAIVTANESMGESARRLSKTVVELVTRAKEPLALPAGPRIPASVLEQAPAVVDAQPA